MKQVTGKGVTVEQAIEQALVQLQTTKEKVEVNIIDEGKKSFLGLFGGRPAVVEVTKQEDPIENAKEYLQNVIAEMGIKSEIHSQVNGKQVTFSLSGERIALAIGKRGVTLNSLQLLTQLVANKYANGYISVVVDAEGYRQKRKEVLEHLAKRTAKEAKFSRKKIALDPMPSFERKIVHQVLSQFSYVQTESCGQDPQRYIVVSAK